VAVSLSAWENLRLLSSSPKPAMDEYFSDRERGPKARTEEIISPALWGGIVSVVDSLVARGALGAKYPENCPDGQGTIGTDTRGLGLALRAEIPGLQWPLETETGDRWNRTPYAPDTLLVLDFIEFCYKAVAHPIQLNFHSFFGHHHLAFDEPEGKLKFTSDINRLFSRNGLAFNLKNDGKIERLAPPVFHETLTSIFYITGDSKLDSMLGESRTKFLNSDPAIRRESLERLWDCWERLKSILDPSDKKQSANALLARASADESFRVVLHDEARKLNEIGNSFHIRHSEVTQSPLSESAHVDYLFQRLHGLIHLLMLSLRTKN
jgi:hypothetical protein